MAVEIRNRRKRTEVTNGHHKSTANKSGVNRHRGEPDRQRKEAAQRATMENQMVMVLEGGRKIRWYRAKDWNMR